ncbi:MAG: DUF881 domain-containing protein [Actinomycetaceae bacterium]|nr:DUF881 domain-containing protein [Actinomycetaceae bacterium]
MGKRRRDDRRGKYKQNPWILTILGMALCGLIFAVSAQTLGERARTAASGDLSSVVAKTVDDVAVWEAVASRTQEQINNLVKREATVPVELRGDEALAIGQDDIKGSGLVVKLWDVQNPQLVTSRNLEPDDLVVHQQDVEAVINALWAGGAKAVSVQGHRILSTSQIRCVGNVIVVQSKTYSPPYEVAAIGDIAQLQEGLRKSQGVQIYQEYVRAIGLGWSVEEKAALTLPAVVEIPKLSHAQITGDGGNGGQKGEKEG